MYSTCIYITEAERYNFRFLMHKTETLVKAALSILQSVLFLVVHHYPVLIYSLVCNLLRAHQ